MTDTEQVLAYLATDPTLVMEFLAEVGGDPEDYGIDILAPQPQAMGEALRMYLTLLGEAPDAARLSQLAALDGVDWIAVVNRLDDLLTPDAFGL